MRLCVCKREMVVMVMTGLVATHPHYNKRIKDQMKELKDLGCQPVLQKVRVAELLHETDDLTDMLMFFPQAVVVRRCIEDCSFCGSNHGVLGGRCVPTGNQEKTFVVAYITRETPPKKLYRTLTVTEHTQCECVH